MIGLFSWFSPPDLSKRLKEDYLLLEKIYIVNYDALWCLKENDALLCLEENGVGG
ncbi:MAG: hypothetical protein AB1420_01180 [Bacillota bacterium]